MKDYFSVSAVFMIPGTGKDVPVQPGEDLLIAVCGINHKEYNSRSFDLTVTGFHNRGSETYAIARMQGTKEDFLTNNKYTATYIWTFEDYTMERTLDTYKVPNAWIVDAVNCSPTSMFEWLVIDSSIDAGWTWCAENKSDKNRYNTAVVRKTGSNGKLQDTNNSTQDFTPHTTPSMLQ